MEGRSSDKTSRGSQITSQNHSKLLDSDSGSDSDKDLHFNSTDDRLLYRECERQAALLMYRNGELRGLDEFTTEEERKYFELLGEMDGILEAAEVARGRRHAQPLGSSAASSLPKEAQLGSTLPPVAKDSAMSRRERCNRRSAAGKSSLEELPSTGPSVGATAELDMLGGSRVYVELRSCHNCGKPGHLRAKCPILLQESMEQAKITERQQEEENQRKQEHSLLQQSADPLPLVHDQGDVHWQGEPADALSDA